ncbi:MAG: SRPBCC family protein [Verrucomicrobiota bacterium]
MKDQQDTGFPEKDGIHFEEAIIVDKSADTLFAFWRDFTNLPKFMTILKSVEILEQGITRWHVDGPLGMNISWDAEIVNERAGELIAWQSLENSQVSSAGAVTFTSLTDQQTEVKITAKYDPPGGQIGMALVALLLEDPERQIKDDLARFKYYVEENLSNAT